MHISKVRLKNIRGIGPAGLTVDFLKASREARAQQAHPLSGWNVIAGPNGSGKSTLLQAMAASLVGPSGSAWLLRPDELQDWIHRAGSEASMEDRGTTCVWVQQVRDDDAALDSDLTAGPVPLEVEWTRGGSSARKVFPKGNHNFVYTQFWDAAVTGIKPDGWMFAAYGPRRSVVRSSPDAASLLKSPPRRAAVVTLFRDDAALEGGGRWLVGLRLRHDDRAAQELLGGVFRFLRDGLLPADLGDSCGVDEDGLCWGKTPQTRRPVRLLGDGYRMLLGMVLDILYQLERFKPGRLLEEIRRWGPGEGVPLSVKTSGVVVVDEPENHLHPAMQQRLGFWLKQHFPNVQFIVTTHSALICQAADRGGLFRMSGPGHIEALDAETWEAVVNGTVDDAVTTGLFGFSSPYAPKGQEVRMELARLEAAILSGDRSEETLRRHQVLRDALPSSIDHDIAAALRRVAKR